MLRLGDHTDLTAEELIAELHAGNVDTEIAGIEELFGSIEGWADISASDHYIYTAST